MTRPEALQAMTEPRREILTAIKTRGPSGVAELAEHLGISYEGARQHLTHLDGEGWVSREAEPSPPSPGRPRSLYRLTAAGDHLFPKEYEDLAVALIDAAGDRLGPAAVRQLLEEVARRKTEHWQRRLAGKSFEERLAALSDIYMADDPFCRVEHDAEDGPKLVEMNCPYLEVAQRRPALCSVTVSVLRRLLGRRVVRTERFQDGHPRCVFRVRDEPADEDEPLFRWEPNAPGGVGEE